MDLEERRKSKEKERRGEGARARRRKMGGGFLCFILLLIEFNAYHAAVTKATTPDRHTGSKQSIEAYRG
jgi:cell division protein FtsB